MSTQPNWKYAGIGSIVLVAVSMLIGVVLSEIGYRIYLYEYARERFVRPAAKQLGVYDKSHWEFDEQFGYVYPPKRVIQYTNLSDGRVTGCHTIDVINELGNIGPIVGDYEKAELKIAVFGDSWTAFNVNNRTWTHFLQEKLEKKTGKKVHVLNFGRDGYGILQMFDLAVAKIDEFKPDITIIAFITNDLARVRTWRTVVNYDGHQRILTTFEPKREPDITTTYDTFIVNSRATKEWCASMTGSDRHDDVIAEIWAAYGRARSVGGGATADIWTARHSYLLARVVSGNPFFGLETAFSFPRLNLSTYGDDSQFMNQVERLRALPVPPVLFHFAFYPEIKEGTEYITDFQEARLLESLERVTGWPIHKTTDYVTMPVVEPQRMNVSPDNFHPSLWGMEFYAEAVARMLGERGYLKKRE